MTLEYYDLKTNLDISPGFCHCHTSLDLLLTANGDLAIITGQDELSQRFFLYLATPKGERYNTSIGCSCLDYLHEKNTAYAARKLEQDIHSDINDQFLELKISSVLCRQNPIDPFELEIALRTTQGNMKFLYSPDELMSLTSMLSNMIYYY